ncbi:MAG: hypothetical protein HKN00_12215 [Flavobacteriaceae bacterium]|nr:hypothetical protein [Bacteroidia bacterium]MBT8287476.1 hypothetical protein [Bacteroidia bacterium]NNF75945.1 hypothetical protein [Flavobacteriaceae bacterium]NNK73869.1 hypothetical protein [Flavobacteriaceae bacterium]
MKRRTIIKQLIFFWLFSFGIALPGYYLLSAIMPDGYVFGRFFRMFLYHDSHPVGYIAISCFIYGILATAFSRRMVRANVYSRLAWTSVIVFLTIIGSSPFGGMLWHYHDMQAGFFPDNWVIKMILDGTLKGLQFGWLIIALSIPYTFFGIIICYFLSYKGAILLKETNPRL